MKKISTSLLIASLSLAWATPVHAEEDASKNCNAPAAAIIGAVMGGLLGGGKNRAGGAVIGAAIASLACVAFNYQATQTKTAQQAQDDYKTQNGGQLPEQAVVSHYETKIEPSDQVKPGTKTTLSSSIEVVNGAAGATPTIEEEVTLFDPDGKQIKQIRKVINKDGGAGEFNSSFSFTLPEGVKQGVYPIRTALYLNGQQASTGQTQFTVANAQANPVGALASK